MTGIVDPRMFDDDDETRTERAAIRAELESTSEWRARRRLRKRLAHLEAKKFGLPPTPKPWKAH